MVGVMPEDFLSPGREVALWVPFAFTPDQMSDNARGNEFSTMVARLRRGATIEQANAQIAAIVKRNIERLPTRAAFAVSSGFSGYTIPYRDEIVGDIGTPLFILQVGVLLVLLIACANVANLQLIRATARHKELAIRTALGAGEWTLIRQLLIEGLVLSIAGGLLGIAVGLAGMRALLSLGTTQLPRAGEVSLDATVLLFTVGARRRHRHRLRARARPDARARPRAGRAQGRRPRRVRQPPHQPDAPHARHRRNGARARAADWRGAAAQEFRAHPGRQSGLRRQQRPDRRRSACRAIPPRRGSTSTNCCGACARCPASRRPAPSATSRSATATATGSYGIVGYTPGPREPAPHGRINAVEVDYFKVMGIPLKRGRLIEPGDTDKTPRVVVIDQFLADRYFKDSDPIGRQITRGGSPSSRSRPGPSSASSARSTARISAKWSRRRPSISRRSRCRRSRSR